MATRCGLNNVKKTINTKQIGSFAATIKYLSRPSRREGKVSTDIGAHHSRVKGSSIGRWADYETQHRESIHPIGHCQSYKQGRGVLAIVTTKRVKARPTRKNGFKWLFTIQMDRAHLGECSMYLVLGTPSRHRRQLSALRRHTLSVDWLSSLT